MAALAADADIDASRHDLRHTLGTMLREQGYDLSVIAEILGHASVEVTARYTIPSEAETADALESLTIDACHRDDRCRDRCCPASSRPCATSSAYNSGETGTIGQVTGAGPPAQHPPASLLTALTSTKRLSVQSWPFLPLPS